MSYVHNRNLFARTAATAAERGGNGARRSDNDFVLVGILADLTLVLSPHTLDLADEVVVLDFLLTVDCEHAQENHGCEHGGPADDEHDQVCRVRLHHRLC